MSSRTLTKIILDVQNLEESLEFYSGLLDLPLIDDTELEQTRLTTLEIGSVALVLVEHPGTTARPGSGIMLNLQVSDLTLIMGRLDLIPASILRPAAISPNGESSILLADPDGYPVLLTQDKVMIH